MEGPIFVYIALGAFLFVLLEDAYREIVNPDLKHWLLFMALVVFGWPYVLSKILK